MWLNTFIISKGKRKATYKSKKRAFVGNQYTNSSSKKTTKDAKRTINKLYRDDDEVEPKIVKNKERK